MAAAIAFAVCPCCPKDSTIQATAKALAVDFPKAMILAEPLINFGCQNFVFGGLKLDMIFELVMFSDQSH